MACNRLTYESNGGPVKGIQDNDSLLILRVSELSDRKMSLVVTFYNLRSIKCYSILCMCVRLCMFRLGLRISKT